MDLKSLVKRIPGTHWTYRKLYGLDRPGAWIYRRDNLQWMNRRSAPDEMPPSFRLFARFCRAQFAFSSGVFGGATAFRIASGLHEIRDGRPFPVEIQGHSIYLNPRDPRMLQVPRELATLLDTDSVLARFLLPGQTFIDIGANHGAFSVAAAHFVGPRGKIVAFEPQPGLYPLIRRSLREGPVENYRVFCEACSDHRGEATFFEPLTSSGQSGLFPEFSARVAHHRYSVPLIRLDDALATVDLTPPIFIKLDVEGSELSVLRGARELFSEYAPLLLMELNPTAIRAAGTSAAELLATLRDLGCTGYYPLPTTDEPRPLAELTADHHQNALFLFGQRP